MTQEALKLALDLATMHHTDDGYAALRAKVRSASKEALAQPEQEPVGVVGTDLGGTHLMYGSQYVGKTPDKKTAIFFKDVPIGAPLYTTPPQRKPFSDEEMKKIWYAMQNIMGWYSFQEIARAIEQAHGIKENT